MAQGHFWESALLYIQRPELVNRRYRGVSFISSWHLEEDVNISNFEEKSIWENTSITELQSRFKVSPRSECKALEVDELLHNSRPILVLRKLFLKQSIKKLKKHATDSPGQDTPSDFDVIILFPALNYFALIAVHFEEESQRLCLKVDDAVSYVIGLTERSPDAVLPEEQLFLRYLFHQQLSPPSNYWLENILKPKLHNWMLDSLQKPKNDDSFRGSIKYISVDTYCANYNRMKAKYSVPLLEIWTKVEKTDPLKFVFEDIAIAAYLVTLWQEEQAKHGLTKRQTFIDIGCGNGLLVHILTSEGYTGYGVDLRRRNIWDHFETNASLIEKTIDPFSEENFLPECDWMIGNHSDELTPWIVFMASCATPTTRAFILPCCPFDFHGNKWSRGKEQNNSKSQYQGYIDYLQQLSEQFGFKCHRDRLRIPSTKRICLICSDRNYRNEQHSDQQIDEALEEQMKVKRRAIVQERLEVGNSLRIREKEETIRNCTRIDPEIKEKIIARLTDELINVQSSGLTFAQAIALLDADLRSQMKKQCGGLQTFIRNHRHIFTITGGHIKFQSAEQLRFKSDRPKTRKCWFHHNHPSGCPLDSQECAYLHGTESAAAVCITK